MRRLRDPLDDESPMRLKRQLAIRPSGQAQSSPSRDDAATISRQRKPPPQNAPPPTGSSRPPPWRLRRVREDRWSEVGPSDAGLLSSQHLESQHITNGN